MVRDVEKSEEEKKESISIDKFTSPIPSLADCWRWLKGLLYDFISLKRDNSKLEKDYGQSNKIIETLRTRLQHLH